MKQMWAPSKNRIEKTQMFVFMNEMSSKFNFSSNYNELHKWSVQRPDQFWSELLSFFGVIYEGEVTPAYNDTSFKEYSWFNNLKLSFSENLLRHYQSDDCALNFVHESGMKKELSYSDLYAQSAGLSKWLKTFMGKGDVLACYMPNISETAISMLATTSFGGVFTSTSSDFGIEGVVDRFGQSKPKVLVAAAGYEYGGRYFDQLEKIKEIEKSIDSIEKIIIVNFLNKDIDISNIDKAVLFSDIPPSKEVMDFTRVSFSDPLYIMYSSGTTGKPKCIVHSVGGTLLQHVKEIGLHSDFKKNKNIFFFTTCGWMMWNWLISSLFFGGRVTLYEGSPGYPSLQDFFKIIDREQINIFGTSPKFLKALESQTTEDSRGSSFNSSFESLETILSTGAPLLPEQFDYIYESIKPDVQVSSICGGTDIIGCFMLGNPVEPVYRGEIQGLGLGMDVACFNDKGESVLNEEGELVCLQSFPSRPIHFLNDEDSKRINEAYFEKIPGVWHHGDFITITDRGSVNVFGRSDATLNPGGVRIGTSEIYRQTQLLTYLEDSLCVGKQVEGDVDVILFVKMKEDEALDEMRIKEIKTLIKKGTTPRHIPKRVIAVKGIPHTRSGKKMEMAVTRLINNKPLTNIEAVANPECLSEYKDFN